MTPETRMNPVPQHVHFRHGQDKGHADEIAQLFGAREHSCKKLKAKSSARLLPGAPPSPALPDLAPPPPRK
jgi:hypothetical protein